MRLTYTHRKYVLRTYNEHSTQWAQLARNVTLNPGWLWAGRAVPGPSTCQSRPWRPLSEISWRSPHWGSAVVTFRLTVAQLLCEAASRGTHAKT